MTPRFGLLIFDDADLLDITGPKEVFSAVRKPVNSQDPDPIMQLYATEHLIRVDLISTKDTSTIVTADGTRIMPDTTIEQIDPSQYTGWIIPGGKGAQTVRKDRRVIAWLREVLPKSEVSLSVCTGAYLLAETGLYKQLTTHKRHFEIFKQTFPEIELLDDRYIEVGNTVIASGVSAGIDAALRVVERLFDRQTSEHVARILNYRTG